MAHISLREAERRYNVTRPTLSKALKNGKISGARNDKGHWEVDTAELARVYKARSDEQPEQGKGTAEFATPHTIETVNDTSALQDELNALKQQLAASEAVAAERQRMLDQVVKQLTDQAQPKRHRWWPF